MKFSLSLILLFVLSHGTYSQELRFECSKQECYFIKDGTAVNGPIYNQELTYVFSKEKVFWEDDLTETRKIIYPNENDLYSHYKIQEVFLNQDDNIVIIGNKNYVYVIDDFSLYQYYYNSGHAKIVDGILDDPWVLYDPDKHPITGMTRNVFESNIEIYLRALYFEDQ